MCYDVQYLSKFSTPHSFLFDANKDNYHQNVTFGISHNNFYSYNAREETVSKQHKLIQIP